MIWFFWSSDCDSWLDLPQTLDVHYMVLEKAKFSKYSTIKFTILP